MAFDYKKEYKEFYAPKNEPALVDVPAMNFLAVRGKGDPNAEDGEYKAFIGLLYGIAFTLKMSGKSGRTVDGWFDYVVPPLEGLWRQEGGTGIDYARKDQLEFISLIRLPDFITAADHRWALAEAARKKKTDYSRVEFFRYAEGLCVQCMHEGPYDGEPATVAMMDKFAADNGYAVDLGGDRYHHEIYLGDPRRCKPESLRTVLRHPVKAAADR